MRILAEYPARPHRMPAYELCMVAPDGGRLRAATLLNLSGQGFCIESKHPFEPGERIELRVLGLGRFAGVVKWSHCGRAGGILEPF
jgi:hypothetical protein